jgi:hypothetical protein
MNKYIYIYIYTHTWMVKHYIKIQKKIDLFLQRNYKKIYGTEIVLKIQIYIKKCLNYVVIMKVQKFNFQFL